MDLPHDTSNFYSTSFLYNHKRFFIEQATLEYLCDINPGFEWKQRGFKGSNYDKDDADSIQQTILPELRSRMRDPGFEDRLESFKQDVFEVYDRLVQRNGLFDFLPEKGVIFVVGMPRTGGTYLLRELFKLLGHEITNFSRKMVHDNLPALNASYLYGIEERFTRRSIFGLAQWIVCSRRELSSSLFWPKKHVGFSYQLPMLDEVFAGKATYLITFRPPGPTFQSYVEGAPNDTEISDIALDYWGYVLNNQDMIDVPEWASLSVRERFLYFWSYTYLRIAGSDSSEGRFIPLRFGSEYERIIRGFAESLERDIEPDPFEPSDREVKSFWKEEKTLSMIERVNSAWNKRFGEETIPDLLQENQKWLHK